MSIGLVLNYSNILTYQVIDKISHNSFFRLFGGHIEFGESAVDTLKREFKEEINEDIMNINPLGVFENIFFYNGKKQHEFVSLFKCDFSNKKLYDKKEIIGQEGLYRTFNAFWISSNEFKNNEKVLYPPQVLSHI